MQRRGHVDRENQRFVQLRDHHREDLQPADFESAGTADWAACDNAQTRAGDGCIVQISSDKGSGVPWSCKQTC